VRTETRHSLKQDRFRASTIEVAESTAVWTSEHKTQLTIGVVALVVLALAAFGGWSYLSRQNEKASAALGEATRTMEAQLRPAGTPAQPDVPSFASAQERANAVKQQLQAIVDKYPHTNGADVASYLLGVTYSDLGDNVSAERYLDQAVSHGKAGLAALAKYSLAGVYHKNGKDQQAIALYNELINKPTDTVGKSTAQLAIAELYQSKGQAADAKKIYEQVQKENTGEEAGQLAQQKLADLK
jgi:predicted negative regulator of RcsB-dependent stress response